MRGFIKVKSYMGNTFIISVNHIGVVRETNNLPEFDLEKYPELKNVTTITVISNMCKEPLCYTLESIDSIEKKIEEAL